MAEEKRQVLIIEDSDVKFREVYRVLAKAAGPAVEFVRAATIEEANRQVALCIWTLVILDISMDIKSSSAGRGAGGHDTTGGLKVAERMFYLGYDAPIVIVTAFDAFPSGAGRRGAVLGLQDVVDEASSLLGDLLVGWVRYGDDEWAHKLTSLVQGVLRSE